MKRRLTLAQVQDIIYIHNFRYTLPDSWKPYFDWYVWEVSHGTFKPHMPKAPEVYVEPEVWVPPELRNTQPVLQDEEYT